MDLRSYRCAGYDAIYYGDSDQERREFDAMMGRHRKDKDDHGDDQASHQREEGNDNIVAEVDDSASKKSDSLDPDKDDQDTGSAQHESSEESEQHESLQEMTMTMGTLAMRTTRALVSWFLPRLPNVHPLVRAQMPIDSGRVCFRKLKSME